ncbi:MAG: elongation factor 4 [Candidatus Sungbacteria bacterium RIFCSPHIGHO2_01_FULL_54_26]|nr:MAG: elongation factor 4 [Candidatus Sungbacteria bacterium RIFCSPHIGHO2_01_FULL_54_26]
MDIRNFVIIAHIDHGKSTLADRFLELTGTVERRKMRAQFLDIHPLEREKGITIKMQPVRMAWQGRILNLIDTPGHADFSYEVSRALAAVEGAILLVDATQGVQAQTLANLYLAQQEGLVVIPVVNKVDLPSAEKEKTMEELSALVGCRPEDVYAISAKEGTGVEALLSAVMEKVPPPSEKISKYRNGEMADAPLRALVFDSKYDRYLGVIAHVRVVDGVLKKGDKIHFMAGETGAEVLEIGVFTPERSPGTGLQYGEIGYVATGIKEPARVRVGDTITRYIDISKYRDIEPLPGYREIAPVVFASLFPENQDAYESMRDALGKLHLEDAAFTFTPEDAGAQTHAFAGRGFRAGFLGLLHMEIVAERLRREYGVALALSRPSVAFRVTFQDKHKEPITVYSAVRLPPAQEIGDITEPWARVEMVAPARFLGAITSLLTGAEGIITKAETLAPLETRVTDMAVPASRWDLSLTGRAGDRLHLEGEAPLREVIVDFYDRLKSISQGFASFSYTLIGYRTGDLVRLDILIAGEEQPVLGEVVPRARAYDIGRQRLAALKELLPKELFAVALQASIAGRIIARETIPAAKKDVTSHMYGGDRTRKMKLWKKQQRGKKRLKETGRVTIPPDVFFKLR